MIDINDGKINDGKSQGQLVKVMAEFTPPIATSPVPTHPLFIDFILMPLQMFNGII